MGLGGYLCWTAAAREIRKLTGENIKMLPVEQHGNFLKLINSPAFYNNSDFAVSGESNQMVLPLVLNNPQANYCKQDLPDRAVHRTDSHIIQQICECYGIKNPDLKCYINLTDEEKSFAKEFHEKEIGSRKFLTIEPFSKSNYTPNRNYPFEKWQKIVDALKDEITFVQVGNPGKVLDGVIDATGKTTFREAIAIIERSSLFLATESGLVHAATSVNTRSVVIMTGYQTLDMVAYPQNINVDISSHGPCGLKTHCTECEGDAWLHDFREVVNLVKLELDKKEEK